MRIVLLTPSVVLFDRNLHDFQAEFAATATWLRRCLPDAEVVVESSCLGTAPERLLLRHLVAAPEFVLLWARVWEAPAARRMADLARQICPAVRLLVWGEGPQIIPQYFRRGPFDGYVHSGDPERVLADAVAAFARGGRPGHGMSFRDGERWLDTPKGRLLAPEHWPLPDPRDLNPHAYQAVRKETVDLSFTVSRGCPVPCAAWYPTPRRHGVTDRRRPVDATLDFMAARPAPYELFQCQSPLFGRSRTWRSEFIARKRERCPEAPFKAVDLAAPYAADEALVADLAEVGLRSLGFGVESLVAGRRQGKVDESMLERLARNLARHGVRGKAFTQVGLPGQSRGDVLYTHRFLLDLGLQVRPAGATPLHLLRTRTVAELDALDLSRWDRKSYYEPRCGLSRAEFYRLITDPAGFVPDGEGSRSCAA